MYVIAIIWDDLNIFENLATESEMAKCQIQIDMQYVFSALFFSYLFNKTNGTLRTWVSRIFVNYIRTHWLGGET